MFIVRQELINDYPKIAGVCAEAFLNQDYIGEVSLIDTLRRGTHFDPELSLVALKDDEVIGHALFYPQMSFIEGTKVPSVILGPIAVLPEYQKLGVGKLLIEEGHKRALKKGYVFSFLWGHSSYYPKFGYMTKMFGQSNVSLDLTELIEDSSDLTMRGVETSDIKSFISMWEKWYQSVDLAIMPNDSLLDWMNNYPNITTRTVLKDNHIIGYLRYNKNNPLDIKMFLSQDKISSLKILSYLKKELKTNKLTLPIYETEYAKRTFKDLNPQFVHEAWEACMINILNEGHDLINTYCQEVVEGTRQIGQIILSPSYEMD